MSAEFQDVWRKLWTSKVVRLTGCALYDTGPCIPICAFEALPNIEKTYSKRSARGERET